MKIIKIGKGESNDIYKDFKNDPTVSRNHCQIFVDDQENKFLTDLKSTNGTFVNGDRVFEPVILTRYDIVRAGNSLVRWKDYLMNLEKVVENEEESNISKSVQYGSSKKKNNSWIIITIIILISFIILYNIKSETTTIKTELITDVLKNEKLKVPIIESNKKKIIDILNKDNKKEKIKKVYPRPKNGYSPYDSYFGKGVYNDENYIEIDNQTNSDAVILLVDGLSKKKIRNEFIRKKTKFRMTNVPDGSYYIRSMMGNNWDPKLKIGPLVGGFKTNRSISGNSDINDRMRVGRKYPHLNGKSYKGYSQTLHAVAGGDVESERLTNNEFAK